MPKCRPRSRRVAAARRHHHGRQRPLGTAAGQGARRGARRGAKSRRRRHRGMLPAGHRPTHALLPQLRELEAAASRTRFPHGAARTVPARRARRRSWTRTSASPSSAAARGCPRKCSRRSTRTSATDAGQHRADAVPGDQLRRPRRDRRCRAAIAGRVKRGELDPERDRRGDDQRCALHRRDARPGPAHPHGRRDASQQLPALANLVCRTVGDAEVLAGVRRRRCCTRPCATTPRANGDSAGSSPRPA